MSTTVTLTPQPLGDPAPFIDVLAGSFDAGIDTVTVWREVDGRAFKVRGLVEVATGGTVTTRDFEAPRGILSSYRVQQFTGGNFVSWSSSTTATLDDVDNGQHAWIHNPLDPSTSIRVRVLAPTPGTISRPLDAEILKVLGRSLGVVYFGARGGVTKSVLSIVTESLDDAKRFDALFGGYDDLSTVPILCVRPPVATRLPPTLFALVEKPEQIPLERWAKGGEWAGWPMSFDEVGPPPEAIITSLLDYADFTAFYADYAAFTAAYADYETAQRDYSIAGTA